MFTPGAVRLPCRPRARRQRPRRRWGCWVLPAVSGVVGAAWSVPVQQGSRQELATDPAVTCQQEVLLVHVGGHHTFCSPACVGFGRYARCRCTGCSGGASLAAPPCPNLTHPTPKPPKPQTWLCFRRQQRARKRSTSRRPSPRPRAKAIRRQRPRWGLGWHRALPLGVASQLWVCSCVWAALD